MILKNVLKKNVHSIIKVELQDIMENVMSIVTELKEKRGKSNVKKNMRQMWRRSITTFNWF